MNELPLISVLMPVYNAEYFLEESINSILTQSYNNFEFIIAYDESTDKSLDIIKKYSQLDGRIIISSGTKRGLIKSLNDGLRISKGKYIARMDADDISLPTRFAEQIKFMEDNKHIGICGAWIEIFAKNKKTSIWKIASNNQDLKTRLLFSVPFAHPTVMIRKSILDNNKLYYNEDYNTIEDYKMWLDCSKFTEFANIPKVLLQYRYLDTSLSKTADSAKDDSRYVSTKKVFEQVLEDLKLDNSEEENRLHFVIGFNERIATVNIDLNFLDIYMNKIIISNKQYGVFSHLYLERFLAKKFLIVVYYKLSSNFFSIFKVMTYKRFWVSLVNLILGRYKVA